MTLGMLAYAVMGFLIAVAMRQSLHGREGLRAFGDVLFIIVAWPLILAARFGFALTYGNLWIGADE